MVANQDKKTVTARGMEPGRGQKPPTCLDKARRTADWICHNQYVSHPDWMAESREGFDMNEDMNFGRFTRNYSLSKRKIVHLSSNWISGMTIYGLTLLNDFFNEKRYLQAAVKGSWYLRCLQNTMESVPERQGAINERIPSNRWCAARDALSGAWGLLRLHRATGEQEFLRRAELFAAWHSSQAMRRGFPLGYYFFDEEREGHNYFAGCQGGGALFYCDLYRVTGKREYLNTAGKLADYYRSHFFSADGALNVICNPVTGHKGDRESTPAWSDMHKYNDDFGMLALLAVHELTGRGEHLDTAIKYMRWVVSEQHPDGGFGKFKLSISSCVAALNLLNMHLITGAAEFKNAAYKALRHLEESVVEAPGDPAIHGGILGMDVARLAKNNDMLCLRVSMYAMYTFLLFGIFEELIERGGKDKITPAVAKNPMFPGLRLSSR